MEHGYMITIRQEKCTGCGRCLDVCPKRAIILVDCIGQIDQEKCDQCGKCLDVCRSHAIVQVLDLQKAAPAGGKIVPIGDRRPTQSARPARLEWVMGGLNLLEKIACLYLERHSGPAQPKGEADSFLRQTSLSRTPTGQRRRRRRGGGG